MTNITESMSWDFTEDQGYFDRQVHVTERRNAYSHVCLLSSGDYVVHTGHAYEDGGDDYHTADQQVFDDLDEAKAYADELTDLAFDDEGSPLVGGE